MSTPPRRSQASESALIFRVQSFTFGESSDKFVFDTIPGFPFTGEVIPVLLDSSHSNRIDELGCNRIVVAQKHEIIVISIPTEAVFRQDGLTPIKMGS